MKIGGVWFNVDLTADRNEIVERLENGEIIGPEYLKTDEQFRNHDVFSENRTETEEKCDTHVEEVLPDYNPELTVEQQNLGVQVEVLLQENGVTRTEFSNQYKKIVEMQ